MAQSWYSLVNNNIMEGRSSTNGGLVQHWFLRKNGQMRRSVHMGHGTAPPAPPGPPAVTKGFTDFKQFSRFRSGGCVRRGHYEIHINRMSAHQKDGKNSISSYILIPSSQVLREHTNQKPCSPKSFLPPPSWPLPSLHTLTSVHLPSEMKPSPPLETGALG